MITIYCSLLKIAQAFPSPDTGMLSGEHAKHWEKNGKTGMLGQDRLEVRWEAVMFLFNVVNLNV